MSTVLIKTDATTLKGVGLAPLSRGSWSDTNRPAVLRAGETYLDDAPAGVPIVQASTVAPGQTDIRTILYRAHSHSSSVGGCYIQFDAQTYYMNSLVSYGSNNWLGYANSNRRVMGLIGHPSGGTVFQSAPTMIANSTKMEGGVDGVGGSDAATPLKTLALNATNNPLPASFLFLDNGGTNVPVFVSGINFRGTIQTNTDGSLNVYSSASQTYFRRNHAAPSPLPWRGLSIWYAKNGSRVQFCNFDGFGFALNSQPPFEMGSLDTNRSDDMTLYRLEIDGRIHESINPARPRAAGGFLWNKETQITVQDSWLHHTRRSGFAMNTNTHNTAERYYAINFQTDYIADQLDDGWAADNGTFFASNVEEMVGQFTYENTRLSTHSGSNHINLAMPASSAGGAVVVPRGRPLLILRNVSTVFEDSVTDRMIRINVSKQPNSTGISPAWQIVTSEGINESGLFDVRNAAGHPLIGIRSTQYNRAIHNPETHYLVSWAD